MILIHCIIKYYMAKGKTALGRHVRIVVKEDDPIPKQRDSRQEESTIRGLDKAHRVTTTNRAIKRKQQVVFVLHVTIITKHNTVYESFHSDEGSLLVATRFWSLRI